MADSSVAFSFAPMAASSISFATRTSADRIPHSVCCQTGSDSWRLAKAGTEAGMKG